MVRPALDIASRSVNCHYCANTAILGSLIRLGEPVTAGPTTTTAVV